LKPGNLRRQRKVPNPADLDNRKDEERVEITLRLSLRSRGLFYCCLLLIGDAVRHPGIGDPPSSTGANPVHIVSLIFVLRIFVSQEGRRTKHEKTLISHPNQ
jgi:hypothetical protein